MLLEILGTRPKMTKGWRPEGSLTRAGKRWLVTIGTGNYSDVILAKAGIQEWLKTMNDNDW